MRTLLAISLILWSSVASAQVAWNNVKSPQFGAVGDCVTNDTAAFQAAINASPEQTVYAPPPAVCYLIGALNGTGVRGATIRGDGETTLIQINGVDSSGNWWDLSGSNHVTFKHLKIVNGPSVIPKNLFLWACTGNSCATSGVLGGLHFDDVTITAKSSQAFLYAYGFGHGGGGAGGSLKIRDSTWTQLNNGAPCGGLNVWKCNAVVRLDALNSMGATSAYVNVGTGTATAWGAVFDNFDIIDRPPGFGGGTTGSNGKPPVAGAIDNNSALILYNTNMFSSIGGAYECLCLADVLMWSNNEGMSFFEPAFMASDGSANTVWYWLYLGGGQNNDISLVTPFWSSPHAGFIALDAAVNGQGGTKGLRIQANDVGLNVPAVDFIAETNNGCGGWPASAPWISLSDIDFLTGAGYINSCGSIDSSTVFRNLGGLAMPSGATDSSHHF